MERQDRIYIAGHRGLVGSAILRKLEAEGFENLIVRTRGELDLMDPAAARDFFMKERPEIVFDSAARVGGIMANISSPAEFIHENLTIQNNIIHNAYLAGTRKLVFLGSSCIYPREAAQPIKEEYLMTGPLEPTNEAYAAAKIAGIVMCRSYNTQYGTDFITLIPNNLYGYNDNFDLETGHALQAMMHRFHLAKQAGQPSVTLWGFGNARREFMFSDDAADAICFLAANHSGSEIVNIGTGADITIRELAGTIADVVGYKGELRWDTTRPEGMPRKLLDVSRLNSLGWESGLSLREGIERTYKWFLENAPARD